MTDPEILTQEWREDHVRDGDIALKDAGLMIDTMANGLTPQGVATAAACASALAALAQAHYAAANVRARPAPVNAAKPGYESVETDPAPVVEYLRLVLPAQDLGPRGMSSARAAIWRLERGQASVTETWAELDALYPQGQKFPRSYRLDGSQ